MSCFKIFGSRAASQPLLAADNPEEGIVEQQAMMPSAPPPPTYMPDEYTDETLYTDETPYTDETWHVPYTPDELALYDLRSRDVVVDHATGGMYFVRRQEYTSSFWLEGVGFKWGGAVYAAQSTNVTNRMSGAGVYPFLGFKVWKSYEDHYGPEGIFLVPPLNRCDPVHGGIRGLFPDLDGVLRMKNLEDLLQAAGITTYVRFIAAYNIQGQRSTYPAEVGYEFCPLDWYSKVVTPGMEEDDLWDHYVLLDQVDPNEWYEAKVTEKKEPYYGWLGKRIGGCSSGD